MKRMLRLVPGLALILVGAFYGVTSAGASTVNGATGVTCSSGDIAAGTYSSITVTGTCDMPAGDIDVRGNITVAPGALLDATTPGDPSGSPLLPADLTVGGSIDVGPGGVLLLGCSPFISCPSAVTFDSVAGDINADQPLGVIVHSTSVAGNLSINGGGGGAQCATTPAPWTTDPALQFPVYDDVEDVTVGGNLRMTNVQSCWLGALRDDVGGSAVFTGDSMGDPDANEMVTNLVNGNLICWGNVPKVQFGDSAASSNIVGGSATGECGFTVVKPNGGGLSDNISVPASSLATSLGSHDVTSSQTHILGTTSSGDTIGQTLNHFTLTGALAGSGKEGVFVTQYPGGLSQFYAHDLCTCSFAGQSGSVTILARGSANAQGVAVGTFQIISGGGRAGLQNLVGWGTFSGSHGDLRLVEHLALS